MKTKEVHDYLLIIVEIYKLQVFTWWCGKTELHFWISLRTADADLHVTEVAQQQSVFLNAN